MQEEEEEEKKRKKKRNEDEDRVDVDIGRAYFFLKKAAVQKKDKWFQIYTCHYENYCL